MRPLEAESTSLRNQQGKRLVVQISILTDRSFEQKENLIVPLLQLKAPTAVQTPRGEATVEQTSGVEASRDEQQRDAHAAETYQQDRSKRVLYTDTGLHLAVSTSN